MMELLVATWALRLALVAAAAVGLVSWWAGATPVEAVDRAALTAAVFTLGGRWLMDVLETPEQRIARLRAERRSRRGEPAGGADRPPARQAPPEARR
jgi:hypothetical protein